MKYEIVRLDSFADCSGEEKRNFFSPLGDSPKKMEEDFLLDISVKLRNKLDAIIQTND